MTGAAGGPWARVAPWGLLGLLVLPFHPLWVDFEQVRRGLLLLGAGIALLAVRSLPPVRGEVAWWSFLAFLGVASLISWPSLQGFEAIYRIAHFAALLVTLRLGAAHRDRLATPMAVLLLLTSAFGLCQRLGFAAIGSYGLPTEPVSVFGNLNVASEWTATAAIAVLVLPTTRVVLPLATVALAAAYLVVDGSRGGMVAFAFGLCVLALVRRRRPVLVGVGSALLGAGIGFLLSLAPVDTGPPPAPDTAQSRRSLDTLEVRLEIVKSSTALFGERPLFGFGPGQFQVQYPRVRSQREIELSSHDRQFASEVRTAHDDWIELLVEGGLPLVLVFAAAIFALQRKNRDKAALLPLFVLLLLMLVRAPLANAPAVAAAFLPVATALPPPVPTRWRLALRILAGLVFATLGFLPIAAHCAFTPYLGAIADGQRAPIEAAMHAYRWMPWEPRWLQTLSQEHLAYDNLAAARKAAAMAVRLRPYGTRGLFELATTLARNGDYTNAIAYADEGLRWDPQDPELRVLRSTALLLAKRYDEAVTAVTIDPHPMLRDRLGLHFRQLAAEAERRGDDVGAGRCRMEQTFLAMIEALGVRDAEVHELFTAFLANARIADRTADPRVYVLGALQALCLGQPAMADDLAKNAKARGDTLAPWQTNLLGEKLAPLRERPAWAPLLPRP